MGKVIALIVLALSTKVNADEELVKILANRALNKAHADLDDATLAKPVMTSGGVLSPRTVPRLLVVPNAGKKIFGGTNKLLAGQGKPATQYDNYITEFGWFGAVGGAKDKNTFRKKAEAKVNKNDRKVFGGTNTLLAGQGKAATQYDKPITEFGWFGAVGGAKKRQGDKKR